MRLMAALISLLALGVQTYPPPYPRSGTTSLIDNGRVQVWDVSWPQGKPSPLHRHLYDMTGLYYWPGDRVITAVDGSTRHISTTTARSSGSSKASPTSRKAPARIRCGQ